jgi:transposase
MVRRGKHGTIRVRRAMMILASASGNTTPAIAALVAADPDTVRDVIHDFNERGLAALDPRWAGGRPPRVTAEDEAFIVEVDRTRPAKLGRPFTHWSIRKLADYLTTNPPARCGSGGNGCGSSCTATTFPSSAPGPRRRPKMSTPRSSWTGSRR